MCFKKSCMDIYMKSIWNLQTNLLRESNLMVLESCDLYNIF